MMTRRNSEAQLATLQPQDLLIQPPLAAYGSTDFDRAEQLVDAGYRATLALEGRLADMRTTSGGNPALSLARSSDPRTRSCASPTVTTWTRPWMPCRP